MDISKVPTSLKPTWDKVSKDGNISDKDYGALLKAAAPTGKNEEIALDEEKFLKNLKNNIEKSNSKEGVSVKSLSFVDEKPSIQKNSSQVTKSEVEWAKALEKKIQSGYQPNKAEINKYQEIYKNLNDPFSNNKIASESVPKKLSGPSMGAIVGAAVAGAFSSWGDIKSSPPPKDELFPGGVKGISSKDINQGGLGDCYLLSAMASLAENRPQDIMKMIKDNGNNTYTVNFPGVKGGTVTVDKPTSQELSKNASRASNGGIWVAVMEKAFMKLDKAGAFGGFPGSGITIMTGHSNDVDALSMTSKDTTRAKLKKATQENKIVTAGISRKLIGKDKDNIVSAHAYSVLSYDSKTDTVRVKNPWGDGSSDFKGIKHPDGNDDGTFTLTLDEFDRIFSNVSYEENSKDQKFRVAGVVAF